MLAFHWPGAGPRLRAARVWVAAALVCSAALSANPQAGLAPAKVQEIDRIIAAEMSRSAIPGVSIAISEDLRLVYARGYGKADLENSVPAGPGTVYRIGSISKPMTAIAAMQLVERGKLDLDVPIQRYVPSFPEKPWPITPRELLAHLSGIRHYKNMPEVDSTRHYTDLLDTLRIFGSEPLLFEPGTRFSYTTYGYCLLGAAVEAASGRRFLDYIRANVFVPAQMEHTRSDDVYAIVPGRARGYRRSQSGAVENCALADTSNKIPGGGMLSTGEDLVRFAIAFERGRLVSSETRKQMLTQQRTREGAPVPYGLGWQVFGNDNGTRLMGHGGAQQGISTMLLMAPGEGVAVAVLANLEGLDLLPVSRRIAGIVLERSN